MLYTIVKRHYEEASESEKYELVGDAFSLAKAKSFALELSGDPGDILYVCDAACVTSLTEHTDVLICFNSQGKPVEITTSRPSSWKLLVWDVRGHFQADVMIEMIREHWSNPDYDILNKIAISIARYCLGGVSPNNRLSIKAIEAAEKYIRGVAKAGEVFNASVVANEIFDSYVEDAIYRCCLSIITSGTDKLIYLNDASYYANASAYCDSTKPADIVREYLPLRLILMLMADSKTTDATNE